MVLWCGREQGSAQAPKLDLCSGQVPLAESSELLHRVQHGRVPRTLPAAAGPGRQEDQQPAVRANQPLDPQVGNCGGLPGVGELPETHHHGFC